MKILRATFRIRPLTGPERLDDALDRCWLTLHALRQGFAELGRSARSASDAIERFKTAWGKVAVKS